MVEQGPVAAQGQSVCCLGTDFSLVLLQGNREEGGENRDQAQEDAQVRPPAAPADAHPGQVLVLREGEGFWCGCGWCDGQTLRLCTPCTSHP